MHTESVVGRPAVKQDVLIKQYGEMQYNELLQLNAKLFIFDRDYILLNDANKIDDKPNNNFNHEIDNEIDNKIYKDPNSEVLIPIHKIPAQIFETSFKYYLGSSAGFPLYVIEISLAEHSKERTLIKTRTKELFPITHLEFLPQHTLVKPLRAFLEIADKNQRLEIFRAKQLLHWHKTSQYCSACGGKTRHSETETAKICLNCDRIIYPHTYPAIVVLIEKGDEILLARSHHFRPGIYSLLAGFVEAGESAEDTVRREVEEEVNIRVKKIRYFGSEPWPFENSFMIAFTAEYDSGEIIIDPKEIEDARWFKLDELPALPNKSSLSGILIDAYIKEKKEKFAFVKP